MRVALRVCAGRNAGKVIPIRATRFLIGRADDCQLQANSTQVSRYHCALLIEDDGVWVRDYGSRNGTFVGGTRISERRRLANGDHLEIGPLRFEILIDTEAAKSGDTRSLPSADTSLAGKLKSTLRAIERQDQPTNEGDILEIVSQPFERRIEPLPELTRESQSETAPRDVAPEVPKVLPKSKSGPVLPPEPVDSADAATHGLKRLFTPKKQS